MTLFEWKSARWVSVPKGGVCKITPHYALVLASKQEWNPVSLKHVHEKQSLPLINFTHFPFFIAPLTLASPSYQLFIASIHSLRTLTGQAIIFQTRRMHCASGETKI